VATAAQILGESALITGFTLAMMLVIEYINVALRGVPRILGLRTLWQQYLLAGVLGVLPGCVGPWAVVAMYAHGLMTVGALTASMIATSGDEGYLILAVMPGKAPWIFAALFVCGIAVGALTDFALRGRRLKFVECHGLAYHPEDAAAMFAAGYLAVQWRRPTPLRLALLTGGGAALAALAAGWIGAGEAPWIRIAAMAAAAAALVVIALVPDHFLEEHLWGHVLRRHALRMFLWTLGALAVTHAVMDAAPLDTLSPGGRWTMLALACLIGIVPQSGPHMVFVLLYAKGAIPLGVLMANSIVQDGHGMLPLLAESRRAFVFVKAINLAAGLAVGAAMLAAGC
jgi:hypothetical protein